MTRCLVQSRDKIFKKGYGFLSLTKNMGKKYISKNWSGKYSQRLLDPVKKSAIAALKTSS